MVIAIIGESCTGKSTLAERLQKRLNAQVFSGKDYLRLAKNEAIAKAMFAKKLAAAVAGEHVISGQTDLEQVCRKVEVLCK